MPRSLNENFARSPIKTKHARDRPLARCETCQLSNPTLHLLPVKPQKRGLLLLQKKERRVVFLLLAIFISGKKRIVTLAEPAEPRSVDAVARVCLHSGSSVQCRALENQNRGQIHNSKSLKKKQEEKSSFPAVSHWTAAPSVRPPPPPLGAVKRGHHQQQQKQRSRNSFAHFFFVSSSVSSVDRTVAASPL